LVALVNGVGGLGRYIGGIISDKLGLLLIFLQHFLFKGLIFC
jgi:nitrate/nitrite transporter NarK